MMEVQKKEGTVAPQDKDNTRTPEFSSLGYKGDNYEVNLKVPTTTSTIVALVLGTVAGFGAGLYVYHRFLRGS